MHKIGFSFDEKILNDFELESFFNKLPIQKISAIELSPDCSLVDFQIYKSIGKIAESNHQSLNFHVPYFVNQAHYDFSSNKTTIIKNYTKLLSIIESLRQYSVKTPTLVLHGATIVNGDETKAFNQTLSHIDYLLNTLAKKNIDLTLSLETLACDAGMIGKKRSEVLNIVNEFKASDLQICWDLCHDYYNFDEYKLPDENFIDHVNYIHMHGKNNHNKHLSIHKYFNHQYFFETCKLDHVVNIELLKGSCGKSYYQDLINDIHLLKK